MAAFVFGIGCFFLCLYNFSVYAQQDLKIPPASSSWKEILTKKKGKVVVLWTKLEPFIYQKNMVMLGIEADLLKDFLKFIRKEYQVKVELDWKEITNFNHVLFLIKEQKGCYIGAAAFSITAERKKYLDFFLNYLPDISVMISNEAVPLYLDSMSFYKDAHRYVAYTAEGSTYEKDLIDLQKQIAKTDSTLPPFQIKYARGTENLIELISQNANAFGFIDLPIYLQYYQQKYPIKRQFIFKRIREGNAFIMPKNHDWHEPIAKYAQSAQFRAARNLILQKYLGSKNLEVVYDIYAGRGEEHIFRQEKAIQDQLMLEKQLENERQKRLWLTSIIIAIVIIFIILIALGFYYYRYYIRERDNQILRIKNEEIEQQKAEIEAQRDEIEEKNKKISQALWQIQEQKRQLEELNESKDKFFSIIAHDLRSPINSLLGFTNLLSNYADAMTTEEVKKISNDLNASLKNVLQLIEDLLTWARSQMGRIEFNPKVFILNEIIREELELSSILFEKKEIDLQYELQPLLMTYADPNHIKFVLRNLLTNALKFTNKKGLVRVRAFYQSEKVWVEVEDNGVGIPDNVKQNLFQIGGVKSSKGTDNEQGTGLGLLLCKEFIRKNDGDIWVESEEGKGSKFIFVLKKAE
ncbi:MAG: ATP-binding protein [Raineya sp.]|nr:ATP-binding protein [Raineya sp.]